MYRKGLGSGENGEFTFLDMLNILSFLIGTMNLNENLTQGDKQDLLEEFSTKADVLLKEIDDIFKDSKKYQEMVNSSKELGIADSSTRIYEEAKKISINR